MFSKKHLSSTFMVLIAIFVTMAFTQCHHKSKDTNIATVLNEANRDEIDKIVYKAAANSYDIVLEKINSEDWVVKADGRKEAVDTVKINLMYGQSLNIKPVRVATTQKDQWPVYEVDNKHATHVKYFSKGKVVCDFYLGKSDWVDTGYQNPDELTVNPGKSFPATFMRIANSDVVYLVNGNLRFTFNDNFNWMRSQRIYAVNYNNMIHTNVKTAAGHEIDMVNVGNGRWERDGILVDSLRARNYVGKISTMICNDFVYDLPKGKPDAVLTIECDNRTEPIIVNFWQYDSVGYVVNSSFNPEGIFLDKMGILRQRIEKF